MNRRDVDAELERVTADFHRLLDSATPAELRAATNGTKWTNKQLLFHMLFGFILVRVLLPLVRGFDRLPPGVSRAFAAILNAATRPFHVVNYLSALPGERSWAVAPWVESWTGRSTVYAAASPGSPSTRSHSRCTSQSAGIRTSRT